LHAAGGRSRGLARQGALNNWAPHKPQELASAAGRAGTWHAAGASEQPSSAGSELGHLKQVDAAQPLVL
jgi:hypothetical protein